MRRPQPTVRYTDGLDAGAPAAARVHIAVAMRRKRKFITTVRGLPYEEAERALTALRKQLGCGGTMLRREDDGTGTFQLAGARAIEVDAYVRAKLGMAFDDVVIHDCFTIQPAPSA